MSIENKTPASSGKRDPNVVSLHDFKRRKASAEEFVRSERKPLYVSHLSGRISDSNEAKNDANDFGDRLQRIRSSLDKINKLIADLKTLS